MPGSKKRRWPLVVSVVVALCGLAAGGVAWWYASSLRAVDSSDQALVRIQVKKGMSVSDIAANLESQRLIRSKHSFVWYIKLHGSGKTFPTGVYGVKRSQSVAEIVDHLTGGKADELSITFFPGGTLAEKNNRSVSTVLRRAGFSDQQIQQALSANYTGLALKDKPASADLEGYIYGETYFVSADATAEEILQRAIDQLGMIIKTHDLERKFKERNLTLHQGIILASIIERESKGCGVGAVTCEDQRQLAGVFYNRLKRNMNLGSDVTYQYAADKAGVARDYRLDSPYNTRKYPGLPPGPIAAPGVSALNAVADPAQTDYLYFLSGDDDITYFALTDAAHQDNIAKHCRKKCLTP